MPGRDFIDIVLAHPFLNQKGGGDRVILDIAKKFNPVIYTTLYEPSKTFAELGEFDIRILPKHPLESALFPLRKDPRRFNSIAAGLRFYFTKLKEDYDVINAHGSPSEWIRNRNPRVCWLVYSPNREAFDLYNWRMSRLGFGKRMLNRAILGVFRQIECRTVPKIERLCAISEVTNERIKKYLHRDDASIAHPGVDPEEFVPGPYGKYFLFPSRIIPEKRAEFSIAAFKAFAAKHKGWKLVIAGFVKDPEDPYLASLRGLCEGYDIEFRINVSDEEYHSLFSGCYATLFSAMDEDWGLTPLESMSCEKPCISVNEGGPRYSILDGKTGYLVDSPDAMAEKMSFLAGSPDINEEIGKAGRRHVVRNFTQELFLKKLEAEFRAFSRRGGPV